MGEVQSGWSREQKVKLRGKMRWTNASRAQVMWGLMGHVIFLFSFLSKEEYTDIECYVISDQNKYGNITLAAR